MALKSLYSNEITTSNVVVNFKKLSLPTEELQSEARQLTFDPSNRKYTTACGRLRCTPRTAAILSGVHLLVVFVLFCLSIAQLARIDPRSSSSCEYCLQYFIPVLLALIVSFALTFSFLLGILKRLPWLVRIYYYYQGFFASGLLLLALIMFCAIFGPYDERRLFGEVEPPTLVAFAIVALLAFPFECLLVLFASRYGKLLEDMSDDEEIIRQILERMREMDVQGIEETTFANGWKTNSGNTDLGMVKYQNGGTTVVDILPGMNGNVVAKSNGSTVDKPAIIPRPNIVSQYQQQPIKRESEEEQDCSYLEEPEPEDFPSMPYSGYQGYRYIREMEHYDNQMMEMHKQEMIRQGVSEEVAEKVAEQAMAERIEEREKREQEENENVTYDEVVEQQTVAAEEEEQEKKEQQEEEAGMTNIVVS